MLSVCSNVLVIVFLPHPALLETPQSLTSVVICNLQKNMENSVPDCSVDDAGGLFQNQEVQLLFPTTSSAGISSESNQLNVSVSERLEARETFVGLNSTTSNSQLSLSTAFVNKGMTVDFTENKLTLPQPVAHPLIIGNINGANMLTTAMMNKQDVTSSLTINMPSLLNGQLVNVVPLVLQDPNQISMTCKNTLLSTADPSNQPHESIYSKKQMPQTDETSNQIFPPKVNITETDRNLHTKPSLSSSDTLIISTASLSGSGSLTYAPLTCMSSDSFVGKLLAKDKLPSTDKPYSLLSNISDRSVSLESIPSISLFKPESDLMSQFSLFKQEPEEVVDSDKQNAEPDTTQDMMDNAVTGGITVVGNDKLPHSLILLVKQQRNNVLHMQTRKFPEESSEASEGMIASNSLIVPLSVSNHNDAHEMQAKIKEEEIHIHSVTDLDELSQDATRMENCKKNSLSKSDTVILQTENDMSALNSETVTALSSSDTMILPSEEAAVQGEEKLSEGFSFNSVSTVSVDQASIEAQLSDTSMNKSLPLENLNLSSVNPLPLPFPVSSNINGQFNKSLYLLTNDGQLTALGYVSTDQLNTTTLGQLGLGLTSSTNSLIPTVSSVAQPLSQCSSTISLSQIASRSVEAKETQTELAFGAGTVYFRPFDDVTEQRIFSINLDHLPNTSTSHTQDLPAEVPMIPASVVLSDNSVPLSQSQATQMEGFHQTVVSLADPGAQGNVGTTSILQPVSEDAKYGMTPPQTTEPQLPGPSSLTLVSPEALPSDDDYLFKCMECQAGFKSKQELHSHEKTHKKIIKCDLCNAAFTRMGNFNRHRKIHNLQPGSENTFRCNDCGREFLQRCDLKRHLLIHTKQEPHRCEKCGKGYIRHSDLVNHMRFHNKDKAFKCTMCDKKYHQSGDLSRHVRHAHKPNSMLTCGHCDRKYACESTLIRHMKAVHKDIILHTVNLKLQQSDTSSKSPSVNTKDVLFTMTQKAGEAQQ